MAWWWNRSGRPVREAGQRLLASVDLLARIALACAAAVTKVAAIWGGRPVHSGDLIWDEIGALSFFDRRFWFNERPFTVPLLHRLAGFSETRVVALQLACDVLAWTLLAQALSGLVRARGPSLFAFALVLGLSLTSGVQGWDLVMRSESASISFQMLALAGAAAAAVSTERGRAFRIGWGAAALGGALLAAFARDNVAYALVPMALFVPLAALLSAPRPLDVRAWARRSTSIAVVSLGLLAVAVSSRANAHAAGRFEGPLMNVIFGRVLRSPPALAYFEHELGMPVTPAVLARRGRTLPRGAAHVPELARFRKWVLGRGYYGYQRYLLTHFGDTGRAAWNDFKAVAGDEQNRHTHRGWSTSSHVFDHLLVEPVGADPPATVVVLAAAGLLGLFARRGGARVLAALCLTCLAISLTQAFVCFHGDAMEVGRHSLNVGLFLRLAALAALSLAVDQAWDLAVRLAAACRRAPASVYTKEPCPTRESTPDPAPSSSTSTAP